jgi:hypothetical protein
MSVNRSYLCSQIKYLQRLLAESYLRLAHKDEDREFLDVISSAANGDTPKDKHLQLFAKEVEDAPQTATDSSDTDRC